MVVMLVLTRPCQPQLPTELLREIVSYYARAVPWREPEKPRQSYKPHWRDYEPLTIASKVLRQLALEAWFEVFYAQSPDDLLAAWPELGLWTRELHCVELGTDLETATARWDLRAFRRLRKLRVDFDPQQSNAALLVRFDLPRSIAARLHELEVHDVSWPSPMLLRLISEAFPELRVLKLAQDLVWCNLCHICRFATFKDHPPQEIVYDKVVGLPKHYAMFLMPLKQLHTVYITISYGLSGSTSLSQGNQSLWTGECDDCMDVMFQGEDFKTDWVERKKTMERPPSLKCVRWRFTHKSADDVVTEPSDDVDDAGGQTEDDDQD